MPDKGTQLLEELMRFKPDGLSANAWAVKAGVGRNFWNDLKRHGNPSRRTLEKLLVAAGSSLAEFEALRVGGAPARSETAADRLGDFRGPAWGPAPLPPIPLLGTAFGGDWGTPGSGIELTEIRKAELLEPLPRPPSLASDPDAYAVTVIGNSMWPRFRPGRRIAVSPRSPVAVGDDVVVLLGSELALINELVRRSPALIELRQYNPAVTFKVDASDVQAIQRVAGELF